MMLETLPLTLSIACDWRRAYGRLADPLSFNDWASGLGHSLRREGDRWVAMGPEGPVTIRFTPTNLYGVLDHWVELAPGVEVYVPLRLIPNGEGCEVTLTLFRQPGMDDAKFAADADWVRRDLRTLKALLEQP
ncbi:polyketide cyclase [Radicibacter daui]|uniref:polyketide cyclase n=1 Tax=Radicibacter daui TaxID=3064829 RepID=UPI004046C1C6